MRLRESTGGIDAYLHMERYVNRGSPSGFTDTYTTSPSTTPRGPNKSFHLCSVEFPASVGIRDYGEQPDFFRRWTMLVHPDMIDDSLFAVATQIDRQAAVVAPTASGRTVKLLDEHGWFLKLCYKGIIGRNDRQLASDHAVSAVEVSKTISEATDRKALPNDFHFFREPFARVVALPVKQSSYEWGIVLREPDIHPRDPSVQLLVPAFSLFSHDAKNPGDPTILHQLIEDHSADPEHFVLNSLILPVYRAYFELLLTCGLQIEAHAQNVLYALNANKEVVGVALRDAESIDKDFSLMGDLGLSNPFSATTYKRLLRSDYNYHIMHSFMFDFKLGRYLIDPIIEDACRNGAVDTTRVVDAIREHNRRYLEKLPGDFFPADGCWYSYADVLHDRSRKRPYTAHKEPRYR